jgi:hypothetical protein
MSDFSILQEELKLTYAYIDFLEAGGTGTPPVAPIVKDVPALTGTGIVGSALNVTNGNWRGVPTEYHYAWKGGGNPLGTDANTYTPVVADVGKQVTCTVSAVNAVGTTAAPPSNAIEVLPAATRAAPATAPAAASEAHDAHADARREPAHAAATHERNRGR